MKLTILKTGEVPAAIAERFPTYPEMFKAMFARNNQHFDFEIIDVCNGEPLPDVSGLDAVLITGSPAGVYEDHSWLPPLREFIRQAYAHKVKMVGICFGHQVIADALGGEVRKSEKGWGLGRHTYNVVNKPAFLQDVGESVSLSCSHQDQVITPPVSASVILASDFAPNAGLYYENEAALTFQPHPEFEDEYAQALVQLRRGLAPDAVIEKGLASFDTPSDSAVIVSAISRFLAQ